MRGSGCREGNVVSAPLESERQDELLMLTQETMESTAHSTPLGVSGICWGVKKKTDV